MQIANTKMILQPTIQNQSLTIRPLIANDLEALYQVANDPDIWRQHPDPLRYTRERFETFFNKSLVNGGTLVVIDNSTQKIIGSSTYYDYNQDQKEVAIGYTFLAKNHWGCKTNFELKSLMLEYAFQYVDRVLFHIWQKNYRSQSAIKKMGADFVKPTTRKGSNNEDLDYFIFEIKNYKDYQCFIKNKDSINQDMIEYYQANFGQEFNTTVVAANWITLKPNKISSYPHAESAEEEFVYVYKGTPHAWINGYLYQLKPGHVVGFKAGTGIAHNFINNTSENIELIVLGERTKAKNKCSFPINPELKSERSQIWWDNYPPQKIGPHDGKAQINSSTNNLEIKNPNELPFIKHIDLLTKRESFTYPNDSETFGEGIRLTDHIGIEVLAVWFEVLQPGKRTSWPHAHRTEEEMAIITKGQAQVWLNGYIYDVNPGDVIYFKPNTNTAHTIINNSKEPVEYIAIGINKDTLQDYQNQEGSSADKTTDKAINSLTNDYTLENDKIYYPLHPRRNQDCEQQGWFWSQRPPIFKFGPHNGKPNQ